MSVIINFHLPKTGGTTMGLKLREVYGPRHVDLYYPPPMGFLDRRHYPDLRLHWGTFKSISSHNLPYHPPEEFWPGARFAIILREPLERVVSAFHHVNRRAQHMNFMKHVPDEWADLKSFLLSKEGRKFRMTPYLAGFLGEITPKMVDLAATTLNKYDIVGLTERYVDTLAVFSQYVPEISANDVRHNDNSDKSQDQQYRHTLSDELVALIEKELAPDYELYHEGLRIFETRMSQLRAAKQL